MPETERGTLTFTVKIPYTCIDKVRDHGKICCIAFANAWSASDWQYHQQHARKAEAMKHLAMKIESYAFQGEGVEVQHVKTESA